VVMCHVARPHLLRP